jgi:hypothetical protein
MDRRALLLGAAGSARPRWAAPPCCARQPGGTAVAVGRGERADGRGQRSRLRGDGDGARRSRRAGRTDRVFVLHLPPLPQPPRQPRAAADGDYVDTNRIRYVYREVYFDRFGLWASMVARCGGPDRFFGIVDLIYEQQPEWTQGAPRDIAENLRRIGRTAGLTNEELDACLTEPADGRGADWRPTRRTRRSTTSAARRRSSSTT